MSQIAVLPSTGYKTDYWEKGDVHLITVPEERWPGIGGAGRRAATASPHHLHYTAVDILTGQTAKDAYNGKEMCHALRGV